MSFLNLFVGVFLAVESILLFLATYFTKLKIPMFITFILLSLLGTYLLIFHFDKKIFESSDLEIQKTAKRHEYYASELGKIYKNRVGIFYFNNLRLYTGELGNNLFSSLDFTLYFPSKYPLILSSLFFIGFLYFLNNIKKILVVYILVALFFSSFVSFEDHFGGILMMPFINLCIATGLFKSIELLKGKFFK